MKRRARRVMIGAGALGAVLVAVLVVACWSTVCDHVEVWHFQLTRKTGMMTGPGRCGNMSEAEDLFWDLFWFSGRPVIFEYEDENQVRSMGHQRMRYVFDQSARADLNRAAEEGDIVRAVDAVKGVLALNGFRVLEQRFPRRAYVVIHDPHPILAVPFGMEPEPRGCQTGWAAPPGPPKLGGAARRERP